jgi:hypothetical protein
LISYVRNTSITALLSIHHDIPVEINAFSTSPSPTSLSGVRDSYCRHSPNWLPALDDKQMAELSRSHQQYLQSNNNDCTKFTLLIREDCTSAKK